MRIRLILGLASLVMLAVWSANVASPAPQTWLPPQSGVWLTTDSEKAIINPREGLLAVLSCANDCQRYEAFLLAQASHHQIRFVKVHAGDEFDYPEGLFIFDRGKLIFRADGFECHLAS